MSNCTIILSRYVHEIHIEDNPNGLLDINHQLSAQHLGCTSDIRAHKQLAKEPFRSMAKMSTYHVETKNVSPFKANVSML